MAFNQVSMSLYTRRWKERLTPSPKARAWDGTPVQVADAVRIEGMDPPAVLADDVKSWLKQRGFTPVGWCPDSMFQRGQVDSPFGPQKEIELSIGETDGEVSDVYCRFTLSRRPPLLHEWAELVVALAERFGLRLDGTDESVCRESEFIAAVRRDHNFQNFAGSFGWELTGEA